MPADAAPAHIQHVVLSLEPGGLENGVVNVANRLDPARFRSSVCCLKRAGEFAARLDARAVAVHEMGWRGGNDPALPFKLARLFRRTRTDIVHTRNAEAFFYGVAGAKLAGVRAVVHSEHGRTFNDRPLRLWLQRFLSGGADTLFAVSAQLKRDMVKHIGIPAERIGVVYNGVDAARFMPEARDAARSELAFGPETVVVGSVGRLASVKNYPLLIDAMKGAGDAALVLIGDGPEREALEGAARAAGIAGRVRFLGHREDVAKLLAALDIFVLPSTSEGMSNTLLEAMAAGVAVVASRVGGNPEIVRDGLDGILFDSGDAEALSESLRRLIADPALRRRMSQAARARMTQEFTIEAMIARYEGIYAAALRPRGSAGAGLAGAPRT